MKRLFVSALMIGLFAFSAWAQHPNDATADQGTAAAKHATQVEKNRRKAEKRHRHARRRHHHRHAHQPA